MGLGIDFARHALCKLITILGPVLRRLLLLHDQLTSRPTLRRHHLRLILWHRVNCKYSLFTNLNREYLHFILSRILVVLHSIECFIGAMVCHHNAITQYIVCCLSILIYMDWLDYLGLLW